MATYRQGDRLEALERILSHLPSDEATRATALSRRWRRVCAGVPGGAPAARKTDRRGRGINLPVCFDSKVTGAIFSKGPTTPIRVLRLHARQPPDDLLDSWIATAASSGAEEIDLALQYCTGTTPAAGSAPSAAGSGRPTSGKTSGAELRHGRRVVLRTQCLRSLRYKGGLPSDTFLDVPNYGQVAALTIDICEDLTSKAPMEVAPVLELISRCKNLTYLRLELRPSMAYCSSEITAIANDHLPQLRHLVLKGFLAADHVVRSVTVLVASTLHLEALSLFPLGSETLKKTYCSDDEYGGDSDSDPEPEICDNDDDDDIYDDDWMFRSMWRWGIPCSRHSLKRINIAKYTGNGFDRILANFLLSNGAALEEFSVALAAPLSPRREEIAMMFRSWRHNPRTIVTCTS
uniref:FBD domain-containing protein n=1 Tax=Aegilops tauschii TaxID=37682 RepID=M8AV02_AEGTA